MTLSSFSFVCFFQLIWIWLTLELLWSRHLSSESSFFCFLFLFFSFVPDFVVGGTSVGHEWFWFQYYFAKSVFVKMTFWLHNMVSESVFEFLLVWIITISQKEVFHWFWNFFFIIAPVLFASEGVYWAENFACRRWNEVSWMFVIAFFLAFS